MVGNPRDGVEGVFDHGLSILNHEPSDKQYSTILRTNQWARTVSYPPPMKKFIQSTLTSPPVCVASSGYLYDSTASEAEGLEVSSGQQQLLFSSSFLLFLAFIWTVCKRTDICHLFLSIIWDFDYSHVYTLFLFIRNCFWFCFVVFEGRLLESIVW